MGLAASNAAIAMQPPCALWASAARGHLRRWRSSTMYADKAPASGAISVAQAIQYFNCDMEALDGVGHLSQVADVKSERLCSMQQD